MSSVNTHDAELNLVVSIINSGSFAGSLLRGFNSEYITDPEYAKLWDYLAESWNKYGKVPEMETVIKDFTDIRTYLLKARPVEPPEFYADLIIENYTRYGLADRILATVNTLDKDPKRGIQELQDALGEFDLIHSQTEVLTLANTGRERFDDFHAPNTHGIYFGYETLDKATLGAHPGQVIGLAARTGQGKALPLDTKVLTPTGWVRNGDLRVGDRVISWDGKPTEVIGVFPQGVRPVYRVHFDMGTSVECDIDHLWQVNDGALVLTTADLIEGLANGESYTIPTVFPVEFEGPLPPEELSPFYNLPRDPSGDYEYEPDDGFSYGFFIGAGSEETTEHIVEGRYDQLLYAPVEFRESLWRAVIAGNKSRDDLPKQRTWYKFDTREEADWFRELSLGLGHLAQVRDVGDGYVVTLKAGEMIDYLNRLTRIEYVGEKETSCISVSDDSNLYVTEDYIVTHNTWMLLSWAYHAWKAEQSKVLFICTEIPARDMMKRLDALHLRVNHADLRSKILTDAVYERYEDFLLGTDPRKDEMIFVDGAGMTPAALSSLVDQIKPDAVYIDGIYMLGGDGRRDEKGWEKMQRVIRGLKEDVALRHEVPVFYNTQFNRDVATAGNATRGKVAKGGVEHLSFGDSLGMWSDMIIAISRSAEDIENRVLEMRVIKGRDTADGLSWHVSFDFNKMHFKEEEVDYEAETQEDLPW